MSEEKRGLANMSPEQRADVMKKAQETRKANAEARRKMVEAGVEFKTPIKAIRAKCLDCCGGQYTEVERCTVPDCPLFPYRFGKRPRDFEDIMGKPAPKEETDSDDLEDIDIE